MAAHERSLRISDLYRQRLFALREHGTTLARNAWQRVDLAELDATHALWADTTAAALMELQRAAIRLSAAYVAAYLTSELDRPTVPKPLPEDGLVGVARDGKLLVDAFTPSLITVKQALGDGKGFIAALAEGLNRALRVAGEETIAPGRQALADEIRSSDLVIGWRRVTHGGCGACLAAASGAIEPDHDLLHVHPWCRCTQEPVVAHVRDTVQRPTGRDLFDAMSNERQDALLGADKAALIRDGSVQFHELIEHQPMAAVPDVITEAPLEALQTRP